ncbi:MAG TPA: family 10 glycosylhydrolase, partial [bacterium]|nr:family 10 glycosylhydrolase [bacterium]
MNSRRALVSVVGLSVMCLMGGCLVLEQVEEILGGSISQTAAPEVPREFRGVWVATVSRIDWPPEAGTEEQKKAMVDILDLAVEMNLNGVVFQVRPAADALYESKLEPWSRYLTGSQGKAPEPYYDPLAFAVEQAHKRGLELHAWFNPYRAGLSQNEEYASNSIVKARPELVRKHGSLKWMDPGEDDVKKQSLDVMLDVVKRYDIDAVHMDDYFYPYGAGEGFDDDASWKKYKKSGGTLEKGDWRRKNVDDFIEKLSQEMRKIKPYVKLGISPFGIWRPGYPEGISGMDQYNS